MKFIKKTMIKKINQLTLFFLLIFLSNYAVAGNYQDGMLALNNNKVKDALKLFQQAYTSNDNQANAKLGEMYCYWSLGQEENAFKAFSEFYNLNLHPNPYPAIYALWSMPFTFSDRSNLSANRIELLNKIILDAKAPGTLKAMAYNVLGHNLESIQKFKDANKMFNQIGSLDNWQLLGEFDNAVGSGFDKDFGALDHPEANYVFKNRVNANVKWFTPPASKSDKWYSLSYYFGAENTIMYAQSFVNSDKDQDLVLMSGCSGSLKIWVNDLLVINEQKERNCDMDVYNQKIKLNKGYNRILVQIGESETGSANFLIRLTNEQGIPAAGLSSVAQYQEYKKASPYQGKNYPIFAETYFEDYLSKSPTDFVSRLLFAEVLLRNDKVYEARKNLKILKAQNPKSTLVSHRVIEAYSRDKNVTDLTKEQEFVKKNDPTALLSFQLNISSYSEKEDYDLYEKELNKLIEMYGVSQYTEPLSLALLAYRKDVQGLYKMADDLYKKYPDNYSYVKLVYEIEMEKSKNLSKGNAILIKYLKKYHDIGAENQLISNLFKLGKLDEAIKMYKERLVNFPYAVGYFSQMANIYNSLQDFEKAYETNEIVLKFAPYIGTYHQTKAQILESLNKKDAASKSYIDAITYSPTDYESRKLLRKLNGKQDLFDNFKQEDIYDLYKKSPSSSNYPNDNCVVLLNDEQEVIYPEGASEKKSQLLVKVFNQTAVDNWKQYSVGYNSYSQRMILDKAEVLKKDGSKIKAEQDDNTFVFTNLEPGDAIYISYKIENYNSGRLAQHFWDQFYFKYSVPSLINRYSLIVHESKKFKYEIMNGQVKFSEKNIEDYKFYSWENDNQEAIKSEPYMPPLCDVAPTLDFSSLPDWDYVASWYSDLSSNKAKQDFEVKETVESLFEDKKTRTPIEKAKIIYDYIVSNITYSNVPFLHGPIIPQNASRTLATKQGDCKDVSTLFAAMCREIGLEANLILVDSRAKGKKHLNLPSTNFDHCIAQLTVDNKKYFIELTSPFLSFTSMPADNIGANCLFIPYRSNKKVAGLEELNNGNVILPKIKRNTTITFDGKDMNITRNNNRIGSEAASTRAGNVDISKEDREKDLTESLSSDFTTPVKVTGSDYGDLKTLTDSIFTTYSFTVKKAITEIAGLKIFSLPWSDRYKSVNFVSAEKREYPLLVWELNRTMVEIEKIEVTLPANSILVEMPKSVNIKCSVAEYSIIYERGKTPNKLIATRTFKRTKDVMDVKDYDTFKDFFNKLAESDALQIAIK
jgi:hypothetical protein